MKKLLSILLAAILCFGLAAPAFADAGGPGIRSVECTVTNPNGAKFYYYDSDGDESVLKSSTIPYGAVLMVTAEYDSPWLFRDEPVLKGKKVGSVNYQEEFGYVLLSDITVADASFSPDSTRKIAHPHTYTVTTEKGMKMYAGPSQVFEEKGVIPKGAEITLTYQDVGDEENYADSFYYTEYNGTGGWIFNYSDEESYFLLRKLDKYSSYTGKVKVVGDDVHLIDIFNEKMDEDGGYDGYAVVGGAIPAGTELTFDSYYDRGGYAPVEYKGLKGYLDIEPFSDDEPDVITYFNEEIMTLDDCSVYSAFDDLSSKTDGVVPAYTILPAKAISRYSVDENDEWTNYEWYLVEYNGKDVWLCDDDDDINRVGRNDDYQSYYKIKGSEAQLFKTPDKGADVACTVTKADVLKALVYKYYGDDEISMQYVEVVGSDKAGWINENDTDYLRSYSEPVAEEPAETTQADGGVTEAVDVKSGGKEEAAGALDAANPASAIEKAADSSKKMIIVCVAAAAVIALTAGVSISLIKKKKGANGNTDGTDE